MTGEAVEPGQEHQRDRPPGRRPGSSRRAHCPARRGCRPRRPGREPGARWRRRRRSAAARAARHGRRRAALAPTTRSFSPKAVRVIIRCTSTTATRPSTSPPLMVRAEQPRQPVLDRQGPGLRHGGRRVAEGQLDQHIGEGGAEEGHHQRGDDLVHALIGAQQRRQQRPGGADRRGQDQAQRQGDPARQRRRQGRRRPRRRSPRPAGTGRRCRDSRCRPGRRRSGRRRGAAAAPSRDSDCLQPEPGEQAALAARSRNRPADLSPAPAARRRTAAAPPGSAPA